MLVSFFRTSRGDQPVQDYLNKISEKDSARIFALISDLVEQGNLEMPHGKKMVGYKHLYEIRYRRHRIIYCIYIERVILLHAFFKKSQETPNREIAIAIRRQKALIEKGP